MAIGIGVNAWVWTSPFGNGSLGLLDRAREMGFDTFEIPIEDPGTLDAARLKDAYARTGLRAVACGAFGPTRDLTHDEPEYRAEGLNYIRACLKLCAAIGAKVFAGPMYSAVGKRRHVPARQKKAEWKRAVKGIREAGKAASDAGVTLAVEPLNRFETDLINTCAQVATLLDDVASDSVRIHLDTFHANIEEKSIYDAVKTAGVRLAHVHACENDRGAPGSGHVDWAGLVRGLKEIGYAGDVVIESFTPECKVIAAAAAIWRPLAESQDALARDGLRFLRKLIGPDSGRRGA
ncbi:MAG: sugar phosphate isomerase/epimerase [Planctomycetota bacterium]|nr:sugar phosphate isomerase/epimerase [Planctomycetota bacterium]